MQLSREQKVEIWCLFWREFRLRTRQVQGRHKPSHGSNANTLQYSRNNDILELSGQLRLEILNQILAVGRLRR